MTTTGKKEAPTRRRTRTTPDKAPKAPRRPVPARSARPAATRPARPDPLSVLVLQGGGALGSYHLGACEELALTQKAPDWVTGISIGAINAALLAGNRPGERIEAMIRFWERVSGGLAPIFDPPDCGPLRDWWSESASLWAAMTGIPGMCHPRFPPTRLNPPGTVGAVSYYDTDPLRDTLNELVDFDYLNDGPMRISMGAVSVTTGNLHFFDNRGGPDKVWITAEHVMASGALPPAFPPVKIGDDWFWDGGLASNTPLQHVLDESPDTDKNIFQIDLFPAAGAMPQNMLDTATRMEDIRFSSRTRLNTNLNARLSTARQLLARLRDACDLENIGLSAEEQALLDKLCQEADVDIVQIIYRDKAHGGQAREMEFSRPTMEAHRAAGRRDVKRALARHDWQAQPGRGGIHSIDATTP